MKPPSLVCVLLLITVDSLACLTDPLESHATIYQLVVDSSAIVLATVKSELPRVDDERSEFTFSVQEVLKGRVQEAFKLYGYSFEESPNYSFDYSGHTDPHFWASVSGNSLLGGECDIHGVFAEGEMYLIFLGDVPRFKAFENIRSSDDLWLRAVRVAVNETDG